jgi:hypothetical protein
MAKHKKRPLFASGNAEGQAKEPEFSVSFLKRLNIPSIFLL